MATAVDRQIALEDEMRGLGVARYREKVAKATERDEATSTTPGARLLRDALAPVTAAVVAFSAAANNGKAGRRHTAVKYFAMLDPEIVSYLGVKSLLDSVSTPRHPALQLAASRIGRRLEEELWFKHFEAEKPKLFQTVVRNLENELVPSALRRSRLKTVMRKYDAAPEAWPADVLALVGLKVIDLIIQTTGWFRVEHVKVSKKETHVNLRPTEELMEWINSENSRCELLSPIYLPMVVPPKDWTTPLDGGYLTKGMFRPPLVKVQSRPFMEELVNTEMPMVYRAVNAIQRTAWQVNPQVHGVIRELWKAQSTVGGLPSIEDAKGAPYPGEGQPKEVLDQWRRRTAALYASNNRLKSRRVATAKALWVAERFKDEPRIYFPHFLDFRGRVYARPLFLTPQGADYTKGLLRFADGIELGEDGACWLAVHGANVFGYDKAGLQERVDWVLEHEAEIVSCASDPLGDHFWASADKPFQFLAFCFEWAGFRREGPTFVSHIPVALDGSCNGLQNFSMALRDSVGGAAVNLLPADKPQDIYQRVADVVTDKLRQVAAAGDTNATLAQQWLASELVGRKLCKKPVMTLPYGAKMYGMRQGVADYLIEKREEGTALPWEDPGAAATFVTRLIWDSIGEVVVAARQAMDFLQKAASVAAREGLPIHWTAPSGFPVMQRYNTRLGKVIDTTVGGERLQLTLAFEGTELDRRRQSAGIAPNFVHSLDAAHLMRTVAMAADAGIEDFAMVHDSYGTHAANTEALGALLRRAFVAQYETDVLEEFRDAILAQLSPENAADLPPTPSKGTLDPQAVLDAEFFFA